MPESKIQMPGFTVYTGKIAVVPQDNVDTDRIIPARFLTRVSRSGYGVLLFSDVRGNGFPLDELEAQGASILVVGTNFGCGSSREHAVWAIQQAGFRAVVARRTETSAAYSDIFRQNSANCGLLLTELPDADHQALYDAGSGVEATIDLPNQTITIKGKSLHFDLNPVIKEAVMMGLDLIGTTLLYKDKITQFEAANQEFVPIQ